MSPTFPIAGTLRISSKRRISLRLLFCKGVTAGNKKAPVAQGLSRQSSGCDGQRVQFVSFCFIQNFHCRLWAGSNNLARVLYHRASQLGRCFL